MKRLTLKAAHRKRRGFTLLEILIVIAIIMVVAAMAVPQLMSQNRQALINATSIKVKDGMKGAAVLCNAAQHALPGRWSGSLVTTDAARTASGRPHPGTVH